jgi:Ca-activated chloride channel family protein
MVLGAILGRGMGLFIPNLPGKRAAAAGAVGGLAGAVAMLALGQGPGRLAGAAALGLCIGLMIALAEELAREAWLVVNWGPNERVNISLGAQPVLIGSSRKAQVYLPRNKGYPEEWATISLDNGKIRFTDKTTGRGQDLRNGSELKIDPITIQVRSTK